MPKPLIQVFLLSLVMCALNYVTSILSNLDSAKTVLIDSIIDLIFPLLSMLALQDVRLDKVLSFGQLMLIVIVNLYFIISRFTKAHKQERTSLRSLICMIISLGISVYCASIAQTATNDIAESMSVSATAIHFQLDVIAKICIIMISIIGLFKIKYKQYIVKACDMVAICLILYMALNNLVLFIGKVVT